MMKGLVRDIKNNVTNIRGWKTDRKIVVFESDDWGSIRMSSKGSLSQLSELGIKVEKCHYLQNDALASEEDLSQLFSVLRQYKGGGRHPVITANTVMANPDFEKIKSTDYREYHYELFTDTLASYPNHKNSFDLWNQGMEEGLFYPQFHGREHLQVKRWMNFLRKPASETRKAFEEKVFGISTPATLEERKSYMAAYDWDDWHSRRFVLESISDGLSQFKSIFGYNSLSTIPPNYIWHPEAEQVLNEHGVRYLQGTRIQRSPNMNNEKFTKIPHYMGESNNNGQRYLVRNCKFEPSSNPQIDWVERCIDNIKRAFLWGAPAIIGMHRVNFIGHINPENRAGNLKELDRLLKKITQIWPEVEFMTSDQLGQAIEKYEKIN